MRPCPTLDRGDKCRDRGRAGPFAFDSVALQQSLPLATQPDIVAMRGGRWTRVSPRLQQPSSPSRRPKMTAIDHASR